MDTRLVRVVCANCEANYRIGADAVRGKVVDYCCSNCGAVIEVDGTAIEMVAPTRPGQDPREKLPRTPEPAMAEPSAAAFNVNTPVWRSDTPAGNVRAKVPPPPTEAFSGRRLPAQSSVPPPMSMPPRVVLEADRSLLRAPSDVPPLGDAPAFVEPRSSRKGWMALATLVAAVVVALVGRTLGSLGNAQSSAAQAPPAEAPQTPVTARLQPGDFRATATDPALATASAAVPQHAPADIAAEKLDKRRKKAKAQKTGADESELASAEESAPAEPTAPPQPTFVAPEPPPPPGPDFSAEAARSALEDAAALAATCRQDDTLAGAVRVAVTFAPSGQATVAIVESGLVRGTPVGSCVASKFRTTKVPPFSGTKVTVRKTLML